MSVAPINPVDFMGDIMIDQGTQRVVTTDAQREATFKQMLVEEVFLKDVFAQEGSIYKPSPEDDGEEAIFGKGINSIYGDYMKKQMAEHIVQEGFLKDGIKSGR